MPTDSPMNFTPNVVVGLAIALLGIILLLDRLGLVAAGEVLRFWPAVLILFGASVILQALRGGSGAAEPGNGRPRPIVTPGLVFVIVILSLVFSQGWERRNRTAERTTGQNSLSLFGIMSQDSRASYSTAFRGADMTSVMGQSRLDLREAKIAPGEEAVVDVFGLMGSVELLVPEDWIVDLRAVPVMGGVRDRRGLQGRFRPGRFRDRDRDFDDEFRRPSSGTTIPYDPPSDDSATQDSAATQESPAADQPTTSPPPRLVLRGFIMMGALIIRS